MPFGRWSAEGSSFQVCPSQPRGRHRSERREVFGSGCCSSAMASGRRPRQCAPRGATAARCAILDRRRAFVDRLVLARAPEVKSPRHLEAVAGCFGLVRTAGERIARTLFGAREPPRSMRWCQRRCDWNVWTRDPDACNADAPPFLWAGWQRPRVRQLPAGGQKIASPVALARPGLRHGSNRLTAVYAARTRQFPYRSSADPARNGRASPELRPTCPPGQVAAR